MRISQPTQSPPESRGSSPQGPSSPTRPRPPTSRQNRGCHRLHRHRNSQRQRDGPRNQRQIGPRPSHEPIPHRLDRESRPTPHPPGQSRTMVPINPTVLNLRSPNRPQRPRTTQRPNMDLQRMLNQTRQRHQRCPQHPHRGFAPAHTGIPVHAEHTRRRWTVGDSKRLARGALRRPHSRTHAPKHRNQADRSRKPHRRARPCSRMN